GRVEALEHRQHVGEPHRFGRVASSDVLVAHKTRGYCVGRLTITRASRGGGAARRTCPPERRAPLLQKPSTEAADRAPLLQKLRHCSVVGPAGIEPTTPAV